MENTIAFTVATHGKAKCCKMLLYDGMSTFLTPYAYHEARDQPGRVTALVPGNSGLLRFAARIATQVGACGGDNWGWRQGFSNG